MDRFLDDLYAKRATVREAALTSISDGLKINYRSQFAEKNFATLLYRCLNSIKKGSSKEIALASRALGLLSITIGCGDNAQEIYRESLHLLSQALKSTNESLLLSVINCLAIVTFVGANDFEQTEASMQTIWHFVLNSAENVVKKKLSASVLSAAISAWSLLLTTVDGRNINHDYWQGAISLFLELLEADDQSICSSAGEAIALICEVGCLEKFATNTTIDKDSLNVKGKNISDQDYSLQELQEIVSNHAKRLLSRASLQSAATNAMNGYNNFSLNVLEVLEVNFVKCFLGRGFVPHMLENEFLHDVFDFTPRKQKSGDEQLYSAERDEVTIRIFVPETKHGDFEEDFGRAQKPNKSAFRKAKTQLLNKQRMLKGEELGTYHE
ncbi:hypothetical protein PHJA_002084600 [Phtheirospermum japonicum]|uniref:Interferon-related developmental regulator N-terminal domain-containing protein n=1 Tax=Phtheirospermum japonicum TaxID=374723 RepID=A0A830CWK4_9LAMI|nr:hypothetical protein PHJA_002084600 [Phtheirospermum japonicum]